MKQRTRVAAVVLAILYSMMSVFGLIYMLSGIQRALQQAPEFAIPSILGALGNAAIALGWIALLKNRAWVWPILVGLMALSSFAALSFVAQIVFHSNSFVWWMGIMAFPFGWVSVPALALLLTDKPTGWTRRPVTAVPSYPQTGEIKKQTRVIAWIALVYSAMSFAQLPFIILAFRGKNESWLYSLPGSLLWVLWIGLLGRRLWAWGSLVAAYAALSVWYVWGIAITPAYYASHHKAFANSWYAMIPGVVMLILTILIPLWALLTDRPSGWDRASTEVNG